MKKIPIPTPVARVLDVLHRAGYEAYIVGGCVRDHLMGRIPGDYDVTTSALPEETMAAFAGWRIVETGLQHGTVTVVSKQEDGTYYNVEVTTFRIDGVYLDNPDSCLDSNWDAFNEYWRLHGGIPE
jgi:tRNA nucleotidyltransferase (CCA-adding enzyme)